MARKRKRILKATLYLLLTEAFVSAIVYRYIENTPAEIVQHRISILVDKKLREGLSVWLVKGNES